MEIGKNINSNNMLNISQHELIQKYYPAFSKQRREVRKQWNEINQNIENKVNWQNYLLYKAMQQKLKYEINNIPLPF
jgi:hypothetical protein